MFITKPFFFYQNLDKNFEEVMENEEVGMYYKLQNDEIRYMNKML